MSSNTPHNMVSSSEVRSSIQKARVSELVKERTVERLKSAEGGAAVDTAVGLHSKALRLVLGQKLMAGTCLTDVSLEDVSALVQTALADQYDVDFMRIAWERHVQTDLLRAMVRWGNKGRDGWFGEDISGYPKYDDWWEKVGPPKDRWEDEPSFWGRRYPEKAAEARQNARKAACTARTRSIPDDHETPT